MRRGSPNSSFDANMRDEDSYQTEKRQKILTLEEELLHLRAQVGSGDAGHHQQINSQAGLTNLIDPINEFDNQVNMGGFLKGTEYDIFGQIDQVSSNLQYKSNSNPPVFIQSLSGQMREQSHHSCNSNSVRPLVATQMYSERNDATFNIEEPISPTLEERSKSLNSPKNDKSQSNGLFQLSSETVHEDQKSDLTANQQQKSLNRGNSNTFDSSADNTEQRSKDDFDSYDDEDDAVYVPFEFKGDGRKREAKRHKLRAMVAKDEIAIDNMIKDYQNANEKIIESEKQLEDLRALNITKKELQSKRNRLTAQLSRDRQKLELTFLKAMCVNYQRLLRRLDRKINNQDNIPLNSIIEQHRKNQLLPKHLDGDFEAAAPAPNLIPERPSIEEEDYSSQVKRVKSPSTSKLAKPEKKSISKKRKDKEESKNGNKGLIASCLTLASVGMVNFMGQANTQCMPGAGFDEVAENTDYIIQDTPMTAMDAKKDLSNAFIAEDSLTEYQTNWGNLYDENSIVANNDVYGNIEDLIPAQPTDLHHPTNILSTGMTLEEAYMAHDIRESFLQRHVNPMASESEVTELETKDFKTKINQTWKTQEGQLYSEDCNSGLATQGDKDYYNKYVRMEQNTQSMFCPQANVIAPVPAERGGNALLHDSNGDGRHDVILEKDDVGNTYLHLVVPAAAVNFLNGADGSSLFTFDNQNNSTLGGGDYSNDNDYDNVFVELGCKVYEVNKVSYKGSENRNLSPAV